ncbi:MAG TPA: hypothetical protein VLJ39_19805 [Tepidisphaeraceae bacterium]|nr:hypothetical protein [Tepidisphaeraceae bacterium]
MVNDQVGWFKVLNVRLAAQHRRYLPAVTLAGTKHRFLHASKFHEVRHKPAL